MAILIPGPQAAGKRRRRGARLSLLFWTVLALLSRLTTPACAQSQLERARELHAAGRYDEAVTVLEALGRVAESDPATLALLADGYARTFHKHKAIATARRALSADACCSLAHVVLARAGIPTREGLCASDPDSAWRHLRAAVACDSSNAEAWFLLANEAGHRRETGIEQEAMWHAIRSAFWTSGMLAYGRLLLADAPQRSLLVSSDWEVASLCIALQIAEGRRPDVIVTSTDHMWSEDYRKELGLRSGMSFMSNLEWQSQEDPGGPPHVRQIERWMKRSGGLTRTLAIPCVAPIWSRSIGRSLVRRAACWAIPAETRVNAKTRVDTASIRAGLMTLDPGAFSGPIGRTVPQSTDHDLATRVRAHTIASAVLLDAGRGADRADDGWAARWSADLATRMEGDSAAFEWSRRVRAARETLAVEFADWFVMGPPRASRNGEYVYGEELPVAVEKVRPVYPEDARRADLEGRVVVLALVGKDGHVKDWCIVESIPQLDAAAVAAVQKWVFRPAMSGGEPVAVWVAVPVSFTLQ